MPSILSLIALTVGILAHLPHSTATPVLERQSGEGCTSPTLRQEWSSVSQDTRDSYISAVLCLATKPSRVNLNTTLYDDFAWVHNSLNYGIHYVANFLPWHRYYVHIYEQSLKDCGYTGNALYWDWTKDAADPGSAAVWDATTGIGGNGNQSIPDGQPRCVLDGPFTNLSLAYKGDNYDPHCLSRNWNSNLLGAHYTAAVVDNINQLQDYHAFRTQLEIYPHGAVHSGIGGDMAPATSPNDPMFFLHHTQIDRIWWLWQSVDSSREYMYSGNSIQGNVSTTPPAALTDLMPMLGMAEDLPVIDVMSTKTNLLCYTY